MMMSRRSLKILWRNTNEEKAKKRETAAKQTNEENKQKAAVSLDLITFYFILS